MLKTMRSKMMFRFIISVVIVCTALVTVQLYQTHKGLAAGTIRMYSDNVGHNGNFGGRAGADATCAAMAGKPAGFTEYRAFISVAGTDTIQNMPTNYSVPSTVPIEGAGGTFANNWADLLDNTIPIILQTAIGITNPPWTGSNADGSLDASNNCVGWTDATGVNSGRLGDHTATTGWLMGAASTSCDITWVLVCIAYTPTPPTAAVGGVAEVITPPASSGGLNYWVGMVAGIMGIVMLVSAGWVLKRKVA
jgi:hypothetical protein